MTIEEILSTWDYIPDDCCPKFNMGYNGKCRSCGNSYHCVLSWAMQGYCKFFNELVFELYFIDCMKKEFGHINKIDENELTE